MGIDLEKAAPDVKAEGDGAPDSEKVLATARLLRDALGSVDPQNLILEREGSEELCDVLIDGDFDLTLVARRLLFGLSHI